MPHPDFPLTTDRATPALALSGGGFRATLFHCGGLMRLNELGLLSQLGRVASVSGGSIAAAKLAVEWNRMTRQGNRFSDLDSRVIRPLRKFCSQTIDLPAGIIGTLNPFSNPGVRLARAYENLLGTVTLQDLPDTTSFVFKATNLKTGRLLRFQKRYLADYLIGRIDNPDIALSTVVAASSAFPPFLSPVTIPLDPSAWTNIRGALYFEDNSYKKELRLTDGGAYDNMGLESVAGFQTLIASDAGAPFSMDVNASGLWLKQLSRVFSISTDQGRNLRRRLLHLARQGSGQPYAIARIDRTIANRPAPQQIPFAEDRLARLAALRTRLDRFTEREQDNLINWGWLSMDVNVRSWILRNAPAPTALPFPHHPV